MLYCTTRSKTQTYTAHSVLHQPQAPDGGYFLPFRMPKLTDSQLEQLTNAGFGETVAQILNLFFSTKLTGWDVDCCIGKSAVKLIPAGHRICLYALWSRTQPRYTELTQKLHRLLCSDPNAGVPTGFTRIAMDISLLFGLYTLDGQGAEPVDLCVLCGDFSRPLALWYAKAMGLPLGRILCVASEDTLWNWLHRAAAPGEGERLPDQVESLIYLTQGHAGVEQYLQSPGSYTFPQELQQALSRDFSIAVTGQGRGHSAIGSIYKSAGCILDAATATAYTAILDYRAQTGNSPMTVVLWDDSPLAHKDQIRDASGITAEEIGEYIKTI